MDNKSRNDIKEFIGRLPRGAISIYDNQYVPRNGRYLSNNPFVMSMIYDIEARLEKLEEILKG